MSQIAFDSKSIAFDQSPAGARNQPGLVAMKWFWRHVFHGFPAVVHDDIATTQAPPPYDVPSSFELNNSKSWIYPTSYHGYYCSGNERRSEFRRSGGVIVSTKTGVSSPIGTKGHLDVLFGNEFGSGDSGWFNVKMRVWGICHLCSLTQRATPQVFTDPNGIFGNTSPVYDQNIPLFAKWGSFFPSISYPWFSSVNAVILNAIIGNEQFGLYDIDRTVEATGFFTPSSSGDLLIDSAGFGSAIGTGFVNGVVTPISLARIIEQQMHEPNIALENPTSPISSVYDPNPEPGDRSNIFRTWGPANNNGELFRWVGLAVHLLAVDRVSTSNPNPVRYTDHRIRLVSKIRN